MKFALGDRVCALTNGGGYAQVLKLKRAVDRYLHRRVSPTVCLSVR
jgi:hypothetical protein